MFDLQTQGVSGGLPTSVDSMKDLLKCIALSLLLGLLVLHPAYAREPAVTLASVQETQLSQRLYATGTLEARRSTKIRTQVAGRIMETKLQDGAYVETGDLLVQLDDREVRARLLQAQVTLREAQRQLERYQRLQVSQSISQDQLDAQQAAVDTAEAQMLAMQAELERYRILAPFSGHLGEQELTTGMLLDAGQTLTTLDDLSRMRIDFSLAEKHLSLLAQGQAITAQVAAWPDQDFQGELVSLGTRIDPVTRNLPVRGLLENPEGKLRPGMLASLTLYSDPRTALMVPARSLTYSAQEKAVFMLDSEGKVTRKVVEIGSTHAEQIEITQGLQAGDRVIDQGVVKLREGMQVRVVESVDDAT